MESRIVAAEVGGRVFSLGVRAERRQGLPGEAQFHAPALGVVQAPARRGQGARPLRRHQHRAHRARRAPGRAQKVIGQLPEERALFEELTTSSWSTCIGRSTRTTSGCSPGGRRGARCASATSAGAWITSCVEGDRLARRQLRRAARCSARATHGTVVMTVTTPEARPGEEFLARRQVLAEHASTDRGHQWSSSASPRRASSCRDGAPRSSTPTPVAPISSITTCEICSVMRSCSCRRRANTSTRRASLETPNTWPLGM